MKRSFSAFAEIAVAQESGTKCLRIAGIETPFFAWWLEALPVQPGAKILHAHARTHPN